MKIMSDIKIPQIVKKIDFPNMIISEDRLMYVFAELVNV